MDARIVSEVDRLACAPHEELAEFGVTADNADLFRPGPGMIAECREAVDRYHAEQILKAGGGMTREEFARALTKIAEFISG